MKNRLTFGIILDWPDNHSMYHGTLLKGIHSFAAKFDINLITFVVGRLDSPYIWEKNRELLYDFMDNNRLFAGFILFSSTLSNLSGTARFLEKIRQVTSLPIVSMAVDLPEIPSVLIDNKPGFEELVEHMILKHGYKDIAYISGPPKNEEAAERLEIVRHTLSKHGIPLPDSHLYFGSFTIESGAIALKWFLDESRIMPEAVLCANDYMAIGAWDELWKRKISIPEKVALTGFDDLKMSEIFDFPFTTIEQPLFSQGYCAAEKLFRLINGEDDERVMVLRSEVVYRYSCGCLSNRIKSSGSILSSYSEPNGDFFVENRRKFREAVSLLSKDNEGDNVLQCWNSIILSAIKRNVRQSEMVTFILELQQEYHGGDYPEKEKQYVEAHIGEMQAMMTEFFVQTDFLNRVMRESASQHIIHRIENIGSNIEAMPLLKDQLASIKEIIPAANISNCHICLFDNLTYQRDGLSKLFFCYQDGEEKEFEDSEALYPTKELFHPRCHPQNRCEMLIELLFDKGVSYGIVALEINAKDLNIFEMVRTRLSAVIRSSITRQRLVKLNRKLQDEIAIRHRTEQQLQQALQTLQELSLSDELTGLYNRRGFITLSEQQLGYCLREDVPFIVFYIDLDGLKKINDQYGHNEGDNALKATAEILKKSFRETDIIARLGGDEFTIFTSKTDSETADILKTRILKYIDETNQKKDHPYTISMSIGIYLSSFNTNNSVMDIDQILKLADYELYKIKRRKKKASKGTIQ